MNLIIAESKNVKISPRKVRLVVDAVKKHQLKLALAELSLLDKRAANPIKKTIESAIANAVNNLKLNKDDLFIQEINVVEGITYKRYHFAGRGRTRPYKKRASHIRVVLGTTTKPEAKEVKTVKLDEKKVEPKEEKVTKEKKRKETKK